MLCKVKYFQNSHESHFALFHQQLLQLSVPFMKVYWTYLTLYTISFSDQVSVMKFVPKYCCILEYKRTSMKVKISVCFFEDVIHSINVMKNCLINPMMPSLKAPTCHCYSILCLLIYLNRGQCLTEQAVWLIMVSNPWIK